MLDAAIKFSKDLVRARKRGNHRKPSALNNKHDEKMIALTGIVMAIKRIDKLTKNRKR